MTLRELIKKSNYKKTFNVIYKNYYINQPYSSDEIVEIDLSYSKVFDTLKNLKEVKNSDLEIHLIQAVQEDLKENSAEIDVCLYDKEKDDLFSIDFFLWSEMIDCDVVCGAKLPNEEILAHILWQITFWGFSEEEMKSQAEVTKNALKEGSVEVSLDEFC